MDNFNIQLPDGNDIAGRIFLPQHAPKTTKSLPLLICIHGGSYDAEYFDIDPEYSVARIAQNFNLPVISISRPSYGGSTPLPVIGDGRSWGEQQGKYLNAFILPKIWNEFGTLSGATCIVLLAHSIGAMVATISAGCHIGTEGYPLAGLITSGIGVKHVEHSRKQMISLLHERMAPVIFDPTMKDAVMLQLPQKTLVDPRVCIHTERLNRPVPVDELRDINLIWLNHWQKYSRMISVPLMYGLGEFDELWVSTEDTVQQYKSAFPASPNVELLGEQALLMSSEEDVNFIRA
ncbi:hypothetical protein N7454_009067 [Penicillium verhagenii]|nr:hypothetical protein N7454_009067 [Penicillium verhagenii]